MDEETPIVTNYIEKEQTTQITTEIATVAETDAS